MQLPANWVNDNTYHEYCLHCGSEAVEPINQDRHRFYHCRHCGHTESRLLIIDPSVKWWLDASNEYCHESAGVFVANHRNQFLFFERSTHPFGIEIPAGHVDTGETAAQAAHRELGEEAGLWVNNVSWLATELIQGQACRRGAETHLWHAFYVKLGRTRHVTIKEGGFAPRWLTLAQSLKTNLTPAIRFIIEQHGEQLLRSI